MNEIFQLKKVDLFNFIITGTILTDRFHHLSGYHKMQILLSGKAQKQANTNNDIDNL